MIAHTQGNVFYTLPGYNEEESAKIYEQLLYLLCSPGHIGTMFQATSTNDITFWVLHPTVDRCVAVAVRFLTRVRREGVFLLPVSTPVHPRSCSHTAVMCGLSVR